MAHVVSIPSQMPAMGLGLDACTPPLQRGSFEIAQRRVLIPRKPPEMERVLLISDGGGGGS